MHLLTNDPERMAYIRANCEKVSMNEMARLLSVPYSTIKIIAKADNLTFSHYSHNSLPIPIFTKPLAPGVACMTKKVRRGTGHGGTYQKKVRPAPQQDAPPIQRPPAVYSNHSPMGIASDIREL